MGYINFYVFIFHLYISITFLYYFVFCIIFYSTFFLKVRYGKILTSKFSFNSFSCLSLSHSHTLITLHVQLNLSPQLPLPEKRPGWPSRSCLCYALSLPPEYYDVRNFFPSILPPLSPAHFLPLSISISPPISISFCLSVQLSVYLSLSLRLPNTQQITSTLNCPCQRTRGNIFIVPF